MKIATSLFILCAGSLLALGMVVLYSAGMDKEGARFLLRQSVWAAVGLVVCLAMVAMDYRRLKKAGWILLGISVALLILVFVPPFRCPTNGASRWLNLKVMKFQSSELAKLALLITLAAYCEKNQKYMRSFWRGMIVPGAVAGCILVLVFAEPDWGCTALLGTVSLALLLLGGMRWVFLLPVVPVGVAGLGFLLLNNSVRMTRVMAWLHPELHKDGAGYQVTQAIYALGSGGWFGLGLGNGRQKLGFVPEHHTDFILSVIGEELGLVATLGIVAAFLVLVVCGLYIAWNSSDQFGVILGSSISLMIGLQAFINIGVVTAVLPNKGLPLPFISYGGSNLVIMLTCVGLLLSIARRAGPRSGLPGNSLESAATLPY
jgi:cell division protein FtsW